MTLTDLQEAEKTIGRNRPTRSREEEKEKEEKEKQDKEKQEEKREAETKEDDYRSRYRFEEVRRGAVHENAGANTFSQNCEYANRTHPLIFKLSSVHPVSCKLLLFHLHVHHLHVGI